MIELIGIVGAAFHVSTGAAVGAVLWWPKQAKLLASVSASFWVVYFALLLISWSL